MSTREKKVRKNKIRELNDRFRTSAFNGGKIRADGEVFITRGVANLSLDEQMSLTLKVQYYQDFNAGDDPYGEHDFGKIVHSDVVYFWKIDYYNKDMTGGSEDPSDPIKTTRVLTLLRADEY
jgi:hypothetical protein